MSYNDLQYNSDGGVGSIIRSWPFCIFIVLISILAIGLFFYFDDSSEEKKVTVTSFETGHEIQPASRNQGKCPQGLAWCESTKECVRPMVFIKNNNVKTMKEEFEKKCNRR